jgi:hypothetical protein
MDTIIGIIFLGSVATLYGWAISSAIKKGKKYEKNQN